MAVEAELHRGGGGPPGGGGAATWHAREVRACANIVLSNFAHYIVLSRNARIENSNKMRCLIKRSSV